MPRLDIERQKELEPKRMANAEKKIKAKGYNVSIDSDTQLSFVHKGYIVKFFPYSGWATGRSIKDGRGLRNLLRQI